MDSGGSVDRQRRRGRPASETYIESWPVPLDPDGVARAILSIATGEEHREATVLGVTGKGLEVI
jgi:hypothetical protein